MASQIRALKRGADILIATPGRLLDHVQRRTVDLSRVQVLVLDEADRMLDMGFIHDMRRILALLPKANLVEDPDVRALIETASLARSGIGWVDAQLLASARLDGALLWTRDGTLSRTATRLGLSI